MQTEDPVDLLKDPKDSMLYDEWKTSPTPENMTRVVKSLDSGIKQTLHSIGAGTDPYLYSKAKVMAAKAVSTYDPQYGAALHTWVNRQLLPLRRARRERQNAIRIPESVQLDAFHLMRTEEEFKDKHGREPDVLELADLTGLNARRIGTVRRKFVQTMADPTESQGEDAPAAASVEYSSPDHGLEALDYVYHESDYIDRKILEHKLGYGGASSLNGAQLAQKLKVSPAQITRRSARLTYKINNYNRLLEDV